jgi:hypothetical protein
MLEITAAMIVASLLAFALLRRDAAESVRTMAVRVVSRHQRRRR